MGCLLGVLISAGCGEDLKGANEKLKKDVADLTVDNERLRNRERQNAQRPLRLANQVADLNMQVSSLTDKNQTLQREIDGLKDQLKGRRKP